MTRILAQEMGIDVVLAGTYCKYDQELSWQELTASMIKNGSASSKRTLQRGSH